MAGNCKWLVLIPTEKERGALATLASFESDDNVQVEICGVGPIVAAARASQLIAARDPDRVMLVGIAGSCADNSELGEAYQFRNVVGHGVGIGLGQGHVDFDEAGWTLLDSMKHLGTQLELNVSESFPDKIRNKLRTVCSVPADEAEAETINQMCTGSCTEDMEAFGVAVSAKLFSKPIHVIRGISNVVGDRDHSTWQIDAALESANQLASAILRDFA